MKLDREAPTPLYIQLRDVLEADISSGRYKPHKRLPSERELCAHFDVSRITVRQAIAELMHEGLIYSRAGKGTFVSAPAINQELQALTSFSQDVVVRSKTPSSRVLVAETIPATQRLAQKMRIAPQTELVKLSRLRMSNGAPLAIETAHLPHQFCPQILQHDFGTESLYQILENRYAIRLVRAEQTIEAKLANPTELDLLQMTHPAAVLKIERFTYTESDVLIEYVLSTYRGDRYKFRADLHSRP